MFYYRLIRTSRKVRLEKYLYSQDRFLIIPVVDPTSPAGKALLKDEYLLLISDAAEKVNTDLVYIGKNDKNAYKEFISDFLKWSDNIADIKKIIDPMIIVKTPNEWELFIINNLKDDDPSDIKNVLWGIINSIASHNSSNKIKNFIAKRRLSMFYSKNGEVITSFLQFMQIVITIIAGNPGPKNTPLIP